MKPTINVEGNKTYPLGYSVWAETEIESLRNALDKKNKEIARLKRRVDEAKTPINMEFVIYNSDASCEPIDNPKNAWGKMCARHMTHYGKHYVDDDLFFANTGNWATEPIPDNFKGEYIWSSAGMRDSLESNAAEGHPYTTMPVE